MAPRGNQAANRENKPYPVARGSLQPTRIVEGFKDWHISCRHAEVDLGWVPEYTVVQMVNDIIAAARAKG